MLLEIDGRPYTLHFNHTKDKTEHWITKCVFHQGRCTIKGHADAFGEGDNPLVNLDQEPRVFVGIARCNPDEDQFTKVRGRVVALERALALLPREERTKIWSAYFKVARRPQ